MKKKGLFLLIGSVCLVASVAVFCGKKKDKTDDDDDIPPPSQEYNPQVTFEPEPSSLNIKVKDSYSMEIKITNLSAFTIEVDSLELSEKDLQDVQLTYDKCKNISISSNNYCIFNIIYTPRLVEQIRDLHIEAKVKNPSTSENYMFYSNKFNLSSFEEAPKPGISELYAKVMPNFTTSVGQTVTRDIIIGNRGMEDAKIQSFSALNTPLTITDNQCTNRTLKDDFCTITVQLNAANVMEGNQNLTIDYTAIQGVAQSPLLIDLPYKVQEKHTKEGIIAEVVAVLNKSQLNINKNLLQSCVPNAGASSGFAWTQSQIYALKDLVDAYQKSSEGFAGMHLYLGKDSDSDEMRVKLALVNLAAFMGQSIHETIIYDACDENNWSKFDQGGGRSFYPISAPCGQGGQTYADYSCDLECPQDNDMTFTAKTHATWWGAPGPLFCATDQTLEDAGKMQNKKTGYWDTKSPPNCSDIQASPFNSNTPVWSRETCAVYPSQKAGGYVWTTGDKEYMGGSVEGCCWWGRGVIQTTGRCNFGILNYYLGEGGHIEGSISTKYPKLSDNPYSDVNFCKDPESICSSTTHPELKWIAGMFYWMQSVQGYADESNFPDYNYEKELRTFVENGMNDGDAFIDTVSGIVNRGCPSLDECKTGRVLHAKQRRMFFKNALRAFGLLDPPYETLSCPEGLDSDS